MIYFDTCYIVKSYLVETGTAEIRELLADHDVVFSSAHAAVEFVTALHRHLREQRISQTEFEAILSAFECDCRNGMWRWLPFQSAVAERVATTARSLPATVFLRAGDAMHLTCATENGFTQVISNDIHLLKAASYFGLRGTNVITVH